MSGCGGWVGVLLGAVFAVAPLAKAESPSPSIFITANRLFELCREDNPSCTAYVVAVADTLALSCPARLALHPS